MKFERMPKIAGLDLWGAIKGDFTFTISKDPETGHYSASAKRIGAKPFDNTRIDLPAYDAHASMDSAIQACKDYYREHNN